MFVLPMDCDAYGKEIPPKGTRVSYTIGLDPEKGKPIAKNVQPEHASQKKSFSSADPLWSKPSFDGKPSVASRISWERQEWGKSFGGKPPPQLAKGSVVKGKNGHMPSYNAGRLLSGKITRGQDRFGWLQPDNGDPDLFVLPLDCEAFGQTIPAIGTRVLYSVGLDPQKGLPKALQVQPLPGRGVKRPNPSSGNVPDGNEHRRSTAAQHTDHREKSRSECITDHGKYPVSEDDELVSVKLQVVWEYLSGIDCHGSEIDQHIRYEFQEVGADKWQANIQINELPGQLDGLKCTGEARPSKKFAKYSVAAAALELIMKDEDHGPTIDFDKIEAALQKLGYEGWQTTKRPCRKRVT